LIITREDEANFPDFKNVNEARKYFKKRYGSKYNRGEAERLEGSIADLFGDYMYFDDVNGQPVQIGQNGNVHVVY